MKEFTEVKKQLLSDYNPTQKLLKLLTRELLLSSDPFEADEIMADMLGLEPDYIFEILGY